MILLNNDTEVEPGFTDALAEALQDDEKVFSAQAKLIQLHHPEKLDDAGNFYCALGWAFARRKDRPPHTMKSRIGSLRPVPGAAIYRKAGL